MLTTKAILAIYASEALFVLTAGTAAITYFLC